MVWNWLFPQLANKDKTPEGTKKLTFNICKTPIEEGIHKVLLTNEAGFVIREFYLDYAPEWFVLWLDGKKIEEDKI